MKKNNYILDSPLKYAESEVTLQYRRPVRNEIKEEWSEEDLANKQAEAMRRIYQEERRRKYLQELQDMSNRRHADNLLLVVSKVKLKKKINYTYFSQAFSEISYPFKSIRRFLRRKSTATKESYPRTEARGQSVV